jgi:predicted membrane metal-binding protein
MNFSEIINYGLAGVPGLFMTFIFAAFIKFNFNDGLCAGLIYPDQYKLFVGIPLKVLFSTISRMIIRFIFVIYELPY